MKTKVLILSALLVQLLMGCAQIEPKDLSLLNHPSLDLGLSFASDAVTTVTGLKNFSAPAGGGSCTVCAH